VAHAVSRIPRFSPRFVARCHHRLRVWEQVRESEREITLGKRFEARKACHPGQCQIICHFPLYVSALRAPVHLPLMRQVVAGSPREDVTALAR